MAINLEITDSTAPNRCTDEYSVLKKVIVCTPAYMKINEVINETQKHYVEENIDETLAVKQHKYFVDRMVELGIDVHNIPPSEQYPEQVFTRDIGFTLGDQVFVTYMGNDIRKGEELEFKKWLDNQQAAYLNLTENSVEGGDVIIDQETVYIGISERTTIKAVKQIDKALPGFKIVPIPIKTDYLHLDCVFNILSPTEALVFSHGLEREDRKMLAQKYELIEVSKEEQFTLGTNVLSVGNKNVFSLPCNKLVNEELRKRNYNIIEADISEIIKSGGSFRCCTLPVLREN